ncbi:HAMP domain-containing histidine kinase [Paraconexibacter antarcticus]|uniref:histidine kinase n=1 Tax=Paraconexibacter antarcticus TaxID=2949664 RepID=A0ABY5DNL1_9ACTN|nr:HAMP domain-containing sensor histidine kinase [Paraconexibacter antarcticus]UTI62773.1 HAMP domain-containing histidine kinase [Paraconexibacter antarcticus]
MLERYPIRWRLAGISALLTFVILSVFATVVGELTTRRIRSDFNNQLQVTANNLSGSLKININASRSHIEVNPDLTVAAAANNASIRILGLGFRTLKASRNAADLGTPSDEGLSTVGRYRVATKLVPLFVPGGQRVGQVYLQYGRRLSDLDATIGRVRFFLLFGVLGGTAVALAGGSMLARRAMKPIADLTAATREIARTRDPNSRVPVPDADDEVAELATTLDEMLRALEASRAETSQMLTRQRAFVADASHELRTPLTSVLANLELLSEILDGDAGDAARSALRSSQRMRRLVADLLLLARADAGREATRTTVDLAEVARDAAGELQSIAGEHAFALDLDQSVPVYGVRDDLHRVALNLMENALRFTPPGTRVEVSVTREGTDAILAVEDDGPGVPDDLTDRVFERFVRGAGDGGGSSGLGLAIVKAVAEGHGGEVRLAPPLDGVGARFVVTLPLLASAVPADAAERTRA